MGGMDSIDPTQNRYIWRAPMPSTLMVEIAASSLHILKLSYHSTRHHIADDSNLQVRPIPDGLPL